MAYQRNTSYMRISAIAAFFFCRLSIHCHGWIELRISKATTLPRSIPVASSAQDDVQELLDQARRLRQDISTFQNEKDEARKEKERLLEEEKAAKDATRLRYSAVVPILKPDGATVAERCDFRPVWPNDCSFIKVVEASLPLGIILGESDSFVGKVVVDEVSQGSKGQVGGLQVGDILRACTACKVEMETPLWQLMAGGIGQPKTKRYMFSVDEKPFEQVLEAVGSNRIDPEGRPILMVIERRLDE